MLTRRFTFFSRETSKLRFISQIDAIWDKRHVNDIAFLARLISAISPRRARYVSRHLRNCMLKVKKMHLPRESNWRHEREMRESSGIMIFTGWTIKGLNNFWTILIVFDQLWNRNSILIETGKLKKRLCF